MPDLAEITNVKTISKVTTEEDKEKLTLGKIFWIPPERLKIPAPRDAAIPATKAKRLIISTNDSESFDFFVPKVGLSISPNRNLFFF